MKADLHVHTNASDGRLSPKELVKLAATRRVEILGITDHDSTEGLTPALAAARDFPFLRIIPGVEISSDVPRAEVHILGYFIDYANEDFQRTLARLRNSRIGRAQKMVGKLADLGLHIRWERVLELAGDGSMGRPHIALALFEAGLISSPKEAFAKYIGRDGPAYVPREKLTPAGAVRLIHKVGGLPVLAHPGEMENLEALVVNLKKAGLVGLEAYYDGYPPETTKHLDAVALRHGLIPTGGSDFHGLEKVEETSLGDVSIPPLYVEQFLVRGLGKVAIP